MGISTDILVPASADFAPTDWWHWLWTADQADYTYPCELISCNQTTSPVTMRNMSGKMDMGHGSMSGMDHTMAMSFHTGNKETILFEDWKTTSDGELVGSAIGIFFMAVIYEGIKFYRWVPVNQSLKNVNTNFSN